MSFVGATPYFNDAVDATKATVKAAPTRLHLLKLRNTTGAAAYLQVFDKLAADVTVGTTVPDFVIPLAANEGTTVPFHMPIALKIGMVIAGTTTPGGSTNAAIDVMAALE
jgi:hypothetical protein